MLAVDKYNFENYVLPELQNSQITLVDDQIIFWFATYFAVYHFQMPISMLQNFDSTRTNTSRRLTQNSNDIAGAVYMFYDYCQMNTRNPIQSKDFLFVVCQKDSKYSILQFPKVNLTSVKNQVEVIKVAHVEGITLDNVLISSYVITDKQNDDNLQIYTAASSDDQQNSLSKNQQLDPQGNENSTFLSIYLYSIN